METNLEKWRKATGELPWGVQHAFHDVLTLAANEQITLVYNADYYEKGACLVNQAASLLVVGGGYGVPMQHFAPVVSLFDQINTDLRTKGINTHNHEVSPMAAEILLRYFAPLKDKTTGQEITAHVYDNDVFVEPTDEEFSEHLKAMFETPVVTEVNEQQPTEKPVNETSDRIN